MVPLGETHLGWPQHFSDARRVYCLSLALVSRIRRNQLVDQLSLGQLVQPNGIFLRDLLHVGLFFEI